MIRLGTLLSILLWAGMQVCGTVPSAVADDVIVPCDERPAVLMMPAHASLTIPMQPHAIHQPQLVRMSERSTEIHIRFGDEDDHRVLINSVAYPVKEDNTIFRTKIITDQPERLFVIGEYRERGKTGPWTSYPHFFELDRTNGRWTDAGLAAVTVPDGSLQFPIELQKNEHREFLFVMAPPVQNKQPEKDTDPICAELGKLKCDLSELTNQIKGLVETNAEQHKQVETQVKKIAGLAQELQNKRKHSESLLPRGFLFSEPSRTIVGKMETRNDVVTGISRWIEMPVRLRLSNTVDAANFPLDGCRGELRFSLRSSSAAADDAWTDLGIVTPLRLTKAGGEIAAEFASGDGLADALQRTLTDRPSTVTRYELRASLRLIPDSGLLPEMSGDTGNPLQINLIH